jgi:hypothetical protein
VDTAVVDAGADLALGECVQQLVAAQRRVVVDEHLVEVARMAHLVGRGDRQAQRQAGQPVVVDVPDLGAAVDPAVELGELVDADARLDVGHVELEARLLDLVVLEPGVGVALPGAEAQPVQGEPLDTRGDLLVGGRQGAALEGGDVLGHVERVGREVAVAADRRAAPLGADRVRGVLDDMDTVLGGDLPEPIEVDRPSREVDRHYGARTRSDRGLDRVEVDQAGAARLAVDQHRRRPAVLDGVGRGDEGHRRHEHLVARLDVERLQRQDQRRGAGRDAADVGRADVILKCALEAADLRTGAHPTATHRVDDLGDLIVADVGLAEDEEL